tara:strand:- start:1249 stop:1488 length:240 start_codon:yes stop_codon:yes gene_type:complete
MNNRNNLLANSINNNNILKEKHEISNDVKKSENDVISRDNLFSKKHHLSNGTFKNPEGTTNKEFDRDKNLFDDFLLLKE